MRSEQRMHAISKQSGAVLAVALILLVVLTLLGITGAQNTILEERMAGNYRDRQIAIEAAELALRTAESAMGDDAVFAAMTWSGSTDGTNDAGNTSLDPFATNNAVTVSLATAIYPLHDDPTYYIERLPEVPPPGSSLVVPYEGGKIRYYRVTAKGWGQSPNSLVVLHSTFYR